MSLIRVGCTVLCLLGMAGASRAEDAATPERSARIGALSGTVSARAADQAQWLAAVSDRVLAPGDAVWTQPDAQARLEVGGATVALQEKTQIELVVLTRADAELRLVQGAVELAVPGFGPGESCQIDTPRGAVRIMQPGRFVIEAGAGDLPTRVTALAGTAQIVGSESGLVVASGQTGVVTGIDGGLSYSVQPAIMPAAETAAVPADAAPSAPAAAEPAVASEPAKAPEQP